MATLTSPITSSPYDSGFDSSGNKSSEPGYSFAGAVRLRSRVEIGGNISILNSSGVVIGTIPKGGKFQEKPGAPGAKLPPKLVANLYSVSTNLLAEKANQALVDSRIFTPDQANNYTGINALSSTSGPVSLESITISAVTLKGGTRDIDKFPSTENLSYPKNKDINQDHIIFTITKYEPITLTPKSPTSLKRSLEKTGSTISLPIQSGITDSNSVQWGEDRLNPLGAAGATSAFDAFVKEDFVKAGKDFITTAEKAARIFAGDANTRTAIMAYFAGQAIGNQNLLSRINGSTLNPNLELLFQGPQLRNFNFNFQLTPRGKDDVEQVRKIIRVFKQAMAVQRSESELFLSAPLVFLINYMYGDTNKEHPYLPKFKPCALTNFSVDYTPDGNYMTYNDGSMTSYRLTMQFQELQPIYNDDYPNDNDASIGY